MTSTLTRSASRTPTFGSLLNGLVRKLGKVPEKERVWVRSTISVLPLADFREDAIDEIHEVLHRKHYIRLSSRQIAKRLLVPLAKIVKDRDRSSTIWLKAGHCLWHLRNYGGGAVLRFLGIRYDEVNRETVVERTNYT